MSDSDSDSDFFQSKSYSTIKYDVVPKDKEFKMVFKPKNVKKCGELFTLCAGETLPFAASIKGNIVQNFYLLYKFLFEGFSVVFDQEMKPKLMHKMGEEWNGTFDKDKEKWIFEGTF